MQKLHIELMLLRNYLKKENSKSYFCYYKSKTSNRQTNISRNKMNSPTSGGYDIKKLVLFT